MICPNMILLHYIYIINYYNTFWDLDGSETLPWTAKEQLRNISIRWVLEIVEGEVIRYYLH